MMITYSFLDSPWSCPNCHETNSSDRYVCKRCHFPRPLDAPHEEVEQLKAFIMRRSQDKFKSQETIETLIKPLYIPLLNVIYPGFGQIYAGHYLSAFFLFTIISTLAYLTSHSLLFLFPFGAAILTLFFNYYTFLYVFIITAFSLHSTVRSYKGPESSEDVLMFRPNPRRNARNRSHFGPVKKV